MLGAHAPPVDALRRRAALAVGTDFNPGTSPVSSMPEAIAFACSSYGLRPMEALTAATANPAFVLGMDDRLGTLESASAPTSCCWRTGASRSALPAGHDPVVATLVGGELVA
jgi:imidazolonepropionase